MEIRVVINKKYVFIILGFILVVGFAIAQLTAPNPGHTINQVAGATPNCASNPTHGFCAGPTGSWGLSDVAIASGNSWNSERLGGVVATEYCRSNGANCPTASNSPVIGSVIGGGNSGTPDVNNGVCASSCSVWGAGVSCSSSPIYPNCGGTVNCPSGSTRRISGSSPSGGTQPTIFYICVKD